MENRICMSCMHTLPEGETVCPHCHYAADRQNPTGYLPTGTLLSEHYLVGRALGSYGDACIYVGYDKLLKNPVFIREFFPADFSERTKAGSVVPAAGKEEDFQLCRNSFYTNVRTLAKLKDLPSLLPVYDIFDENETVYAIYDYCEGKSLSRELKARGGRISWDEMRPLFMQLMTSICALHRAGVYHLAISPDTVLIAPDGKLRLRSFAIPQARTTGTAIRPRLCAGFSAPEQYTMNTPCGAAADVYGLAATIFCTVTGNTPPEAPHRANGAQDLFMPAEVAEELPENMEVALFNALQTDTVKRIQTMEEFQQLLSAESTVHALLEDEETPEEDVTDAAPKNRYPLYIGITVFVVLAILAGILLLILFPQNKPAAPSDTLTTTTTVQQAETTTAYIEPTNQYSVPNLVGKNYYNEKNTTMLGDFQLEIEALKYDKKKSKGTILSQEPAADTAVEAGTTVKVVISLGSDEIKVPDITGWPQVYAEKYLQALGLNVSVTKVNVSDFAKDLCEGTDPEKDTVLHAGDTVTLRVSNVETSEPSSDITD